MIKYLSIVFLLFSFVCKANSTPSKKSCQFYVEKEKEVRCKKTEYDYLLGYGQKYCSEFLNLNKDKDSDQQLKKWITSTLLCLQEMINDNKKRVSPCKQLESFAFDSHPICYKQYGVCSLSVNNLWKLIRTVEIIDYISVKAAIQIDNVFFSCLAEYFSSVTNLFLNEVSASKYGSDAKAKDYIVGILRNSPNKFNEANKYFEFLFPFIDKNISSEQATKALAYYNTTNDSQLRPFVMMARQGEGKPTKPKKEVSLSRLEKAYKASQIYKNKSKK